MVQGFKQFHIEVPELELALTASRQLLGVAPHANCFHLANVEIVLHQNKALAAGKIRGLTFWDDKAASVGALAGRDCRGLQLALSDSPPAAARVSDIQAVDHLVLHTSDADACIGLFGEEGLGLRLALDKMAPQWGGRMLFFRTGKLTLEVIQSLESPPPTDFFWGISFACAELDTTLARLSANGVAHSAARDGRKPGTRVATLKSHNLGLPTLLLQPAG